MSTNQAASLSGQGYKERSRRLRASRVCPFLSYIHTTLRKALQDAMSDGLIPRNVADGIKAPRPKKKEINPLSPKQARAFLEAVRGDRLEALYVLAVHRGLRQGE